jgi:hypothetical protein
MEYIMKSTSLSETAQANTNPENQQSNLDIMLKINLLAACIKFERNRLMFELLIRLAIRMQEDRYKDEDPEDEDDLDNEEDMEGEDEQDDDYNPDFELTDEDGLDWDEDRDENGLPYWVPDEVWNPEDELDAEEETEPVDSKIVPMGWDVDQDNYDDPCEREEDY